MKLLSLIASLSAVSEAFHVQHGSIRGLQKKKVSATMKEMSTTTTTITTTTTTSRSASARRGATASSSTNLAYGYPSPGPQSPTGQNVMDHLFFLSEEEWKDAREEGQYDLVVIGTGPCGLAVVQRALDNDPHCRILMLERGTLFLPEHFQNLPTPYKETLGGLSETFPWTLSATTARGERGGHIRWQHGMVPFVGGRSTVWSAWCPTPQDDELVGWPESIVQGMRDNLEAAKELLNVQAADEVDAIHSPLALEQITKQRPVYGALQQRVGELLKAKLPESHHTCNQEGIYHTEPAQIASDARAVDGTDFKKFSSPPALLELAVAQRESGLGALDIVVGCEISRILMQEGRATALETSRGTLPLGDAQLVLAMGQLPATTLVRHAFPESRAGERFSSHFITSVVARVPRKDLEEMSGQFGELELGASYIAGTAGGDFSKQFHIQLSSLSDKMPEKNAAKALRYMPDVVATASMAQLRTSKDYVVFVCAVLGELDSENEDNWFRANPQDPNPLTDSLLQIVENDDDADTWASMDKATFHVLEEVLSPGGPGRVEYWHDTAEGAGEWSTTRVTEDERRVSGCVHESSTLHIGSDVEAPVDLNYCVRGSENVFVTGAALWPKGGSFNPTLAMVALAMDLVDKLVPKKQ